jgi:hypothetical protein
MLDVCHAPHRRDVVALFNSIEPERRSLESTEPTRLTVTLDIGKVLAATILGVVLVAGSIVLWANKMEAPAGALFALGEAVITGGLGITLGERSGAIEGGQKAAKRP